MNYSYSKQVSHEKNSDCIKDADEIAVEKGFKPGYFRAEFWTNSIGEYVNEYYYQDEDYDNKLLHVYIFNTFRKEQKDKAAKLLTINND